MSIKRKRISSHLRLFSFLFVLPIVAITTFERNDIEKQNPRSPASIPHSSHKAFPQKSLIKNFSPIKQAAKSNSTFGFSVTEEVLEVYRESNLAKILVKVKFESFINSESVQVSWKLPESYKIIEGRKSETFHAMRVGDQYDLRLIIEGNPFTERPSFLEISSLVGSTKLGAVAPINLRQSLSAYLKTDNDQETEQPNKSFSEKTEEKKKYKLIF